MKMRGWMTLSAMMTLACAAPTLAGDTVDSVLKKISEKMSKHQSLRYKTELKADYKFPTFAQKMNTVTRSEYLKKGQGCASRQETTSDTVTKMEGQEAVKSRNESLIISDGDALYMLSDTDGQKTALKQPINPATNFNPFDQARLFEESRKQFDYKLLPDQTVGGKPCWVIELRAKNPQPNEPMNRAHMFIDKDNCMTIRHVSFDAEGRETATMVTDDIKFDAPIPADRFVFKAPPGVEVQDISKMTMPATMKPHSEGGK